jgi:CRISPR-associated protein Cmr4
MFEAACILFLYADTPLHPGTGRGLGGVDLPIQRERVSGYPMIQASGLKGVLRAEAQVRINQKLTKEEFYAIFGPETEEASEHAGALAPGDARLLLFPVRSLAGVFAWTTSLDVLARFKREAAFAGLDIPWDLPSKPSEREALIYGNSLKAGDKIVLEEFTFTPKQEHLVQQIGQWLAKNALPEGPEYQYWRDILPEHLVILHDDTFRDFITFSTEVVTRIRLIPETKTVAEGALWTEEYLPVDTLLYAPLMATKSRAQKKAALNAEQVLGKVIGLGLTRIQLGGDETVGRGIAALRFLYRR